MTMENMRLAVLIDGDNAPRDCLKSIMEEIAIYGTVVFCGKSLYHNVIFLREVAQPWFGFRLDGPGRSVPIRSPAWAFVKGRRA